MGVVVGGKPRERSSFHLEDAWPKTVDLPSGLVLENVLEGKAVLPQPKPGDAIVKGGNLADALPDLKLVRKATLAEGKVILFGFEFKSDFARKRWERELSLGAARLDDGKEPEGRSLFYLGTTELRPSPGALAAVELMLPVLQRKMKEAAEKYRE